MLSPVLWVVRLRTSSAWHVFCSASVVAARIISLRRFRTEMWRSLKRCDSGIISMVRYVPPSKFGLICMWRGHHSQMVRSRDLLLVTGPFWKRWRCFARRVMNASRSNPQIVRVEAHSTFTDGAEFLVSAAQALRFFTGITSADGYRKLTEHLGPDKRV